MKPKRRTAKKKTSVEKKDGGFAGVLCKIGVKFLKILLDTPSNQINI